MPEYNIATRQEELHFYSSDREVRIGQSIAERVEEEFEFVKDPLVQNRVEKIGKKIAAVCDRRDIVYHFFVIEEDEMIVSARESIREAMEKRLEEGVITSSDYLTELNREEEARINLEKARLELLANQLAYKIINGG